MAEVVCPGWRASWVNAWLAAVGATVLDERIQLNWTTSAGPVAVLSAKTIDPVTALIESWPDAQSLSRLPIARERLGALEMKRTVPLEVFTERARVARRRKDSWTLSSTMTDLSVGEQGAAAHALFDPSAPGGRTLHQRLIAVHEHVDPRSGQVRDSMAGQADRVQANGLGFDQTRIGSLHDATKPWVDPVVECLAFFGLALLPVRGQGAANVSARQRGWRQVVGSEEQRIFSFHWPAWSQPLDSDGIDALLDAWSREREGGWARLGVRAAWRSMKYEPRGAEDSTRAIGAVRL